MKAQHQNKTSDTLDITYSETIVDPIVLVSPQYAPGSNSINEQTITSQVLGKASLRSTNVGENTFYINSFVIKSGETTFGETTIAAGKKEKFHDKLEINLAPASFNFNDPVVILTSYNEDAISATPNIDTIDDLSKSEVHITSTNKTTTENKYYTNYLVLDQGVFTNARSKVIAAGIANKTGNGKLRIYYNHDFGSNASPIVLVSSWYNDANQAVTSAETITTVEGEYFEVDSGNYAENYFVSWVAIQP